MNIRTNKSRASHSVRHNRCAKLSCVWAVVLFVFSIFVSSVEAQSYISGQVFDDQNANGTQDTSDGVLSGITLEIYADDGEGNIGGQAFDAQSTFFDGAYRFNDLANGRYCVRVNSEDSIATNPPETLGQMCGLEIDVFAGVTKVQNVDFGLFEGFSLRGSVFADEDYDTIQSQSEETLSGVQVELLQGDGAGNSVGFALQTDISGSQGSYQFDKLDEGTYCLRVVGADKIKTSPVAVDFGTDTPGERCDLNFELKVGGRTQTILNNQNFGLFSGFDLGGVVFEDLNNSGSVDPSEQGVSSQLVELYQHDGLGGVSGQPLSSAITGSGGAYSFMDLKAGSYCLSYNSVSGFQSTASQICGIEFGTNEGLPDKTSLYDQNFGVFEGFAVSGLVYEDLNNSASRDEGEAGIATRQIALYKTDPVAGIPGTLVGTYVTDPTGSYRFNKLAKGSYC
ncbi:MAG: MSCRAMM family protein, partial [Alphaproteobacteria bacterium]